MIQKLLLVMIIALATSAGLFAQSTGTLNGTVTDAVTGEPIPFANISIEQNGSVVTGGTTDFNGNFSIKPIPAGRYDVAASFLGYATAKFTSVQIQAGPITFQDFKLNPAADILAEVEVYEYKVPLIAKDQTTSGGTVTSEEISKMPGRSAAAVATTVGGVYSEDGGVGSIRGARSDATSYYVDGVKVSASVPKAAIEQVQVITGGLPAQYGDVTGGIISMTMKGPTSQYFGGAELVTSSFLDPYNYNLAALTLSGPILSVKEKGTERKRTIAGFLLSAEGIYQEDPSPSPVAVWRANDDVIEDILANPLVLDNSSGTPILQPKGNYLRKDDFSKHKSHINLGYKGVNVAGKIDISPVRDLNFTFGGTWNYRDSKLGTGQMFNHANVGKGVSHNMMVYGRMSQRFRDKEAEEGAKASVIKNPYYQVQVDYAKSISKSYNEEFDTDFFRYGHIGYFDMEATEYYISNMLDTASGYTGNVMEAFVYRVNGFEAGPYNKDLARYTEQYFEYFPIDQYGSPELDMIQTRNGLLNGNGAPGIYSAPGVGTLYSSPGTKYTGYSKGEGSQFRVTASGSADIGGHEISLGFEFEQSKSIGYGLSPFALWSLARQNLNKHISERDLDNPIVMFDDNGFFLDTIKYNRLYNETSQSEFDKNIREHLGYAIDGFEWINVDGMNPDELKLEWFSAEELINGGGNKSAVSYYGYDHLGNKLKSQPTIDDFFNNKKDRPIGAVTPNYIAAYIQDKFAFKDLIFNVGLRIDRFDANQKVLKDQYLMFEAYTRGDAQTDALLNGDVHPANISNDAVVYVDNVENPTRIMGYRSGSVWYNASGAEVENPTAISGSTGISPYLVDRSTEREMNSGAFEDYKPQIKVLPRISFSFPISDEALFFAHYDILSRRPSAGYSLSLLTYYYIQQNNTSPINNPNLKPEMTVDYELGFQQKLGNSSALKLSAFYREMRDMQQAIAVNGAYPSSYYTFGNIDFGTVKGFTATYDLRRTGNVSLRASYTLQFAKGTGSSYNSGASIVTSNKPNLRTTLPLNYDQRHAFAITLDYRFGGKANGTAYNGPKIGGKNILANTGVNFVVNTGSGSPYTRRSKPGDGAVIIGSMNGARKPWRTSVNMRLDRDIRLRLAERKEDGTKEKYGYLNVYLEISNLLNLKTVLNVYDYTGNAEDTGYLSHPDYQRDIQQQIDEIAYRNYYTMYYGYNAGNYISPRTIRLGVQFSF